LVAKALHSVEIFVNCNVIAGATLACAIKVVPVQNAARDYRVLTAKWRAQVIVQNLPLPVVTATEIASLVAFHHGLDRNVMLNAAGHVPTVCTVSTQMIANAHLH